MLTKKKKRRLQFLTIEDRTGGLVRKHKCQGNPSCLIDALPGTTRLPYFGSPLARVTLAVGLPYLLVNMAFNYQAKNIRRDFTGYYELREPIRELVDQRICL